MKGTQTCQDCELARAACEMERGAFDLVEFRKTRV